VDLTPQDLWSLRNIITRAVNESHEVLATAARRARADQRERPVPVPQPIAPPPPLTHDRTPRLAYSIKDAATALGISRATLYRLINVGELRTLRIGGRRLIQTTDIEALLSRGQSRP
jgi:excisionase family DNA binding protein